ncbi:MAG: 3-deoxy-D-manno-octulosonic acid transferase [Alphaproteobacteria bacterium]|nr:3-deoxy-D-manno-octulosonic acid transferase [Alphaproteobacteria bacterium]
MMPALYRGATDLAAPVIEMALERRRRRGREDELRMAERRGAPSRPRPAGPLVWLHAASVGEAQATLSLVARLVEGGRRHVLVTTGTVTSARLLGQRLPDGAFHQYVPVDRAAWVRRFLAHWRPDLALWVQSEFWPNLVLETKAAGVPMAVINARMSERSFRRWRYLGGLIRPMLEAFALCLAADAEHARRFEALGARAVRVAGNLKFAAAPLPVDSTARQTLNAMIGDRPRWLAASTHDGEELAAIATHRSVASGRPGLLTIIVPRYPERGPQIAELAAASGLAVARRAAGDAIETATDVYVADTMGEMGLFYEVAPIVFVGGSITPRGGHNPIEPAAFDCAILHGPDMANNREIAAELAAAGATLVVNDATALADEVTRLFADPALRAERAKAARRVTADSGAVLDRVLDVLAPYLAGSSGART